MKNVVNEEEERKYITKKVCSEKLFVEQISCVLENLF